MKRNSDEGLAVEPVANRAVVLIVPSGMNDAKVFLADLDDESGESSDHAKVFELADGRALLVFPDPDAEKVKS